MRLTVARIGRAHGIRGEVTIEVRTDAPEDRFALGNQLQVVDGARKRELEASGLPTTLTVTAARDHKNTILLAFAEIADRTMAEAMRDVLLECDVPEASDEDDAWYDHQLVGLKAVDPEGQDLGSVIAVEHLPAQDLLVIRRPEGHKARVPFVSAIVPEVDLEAGHIVVDAPGGLLEADFG